MRSSRLRATAVLLAWSAVTLGIPYVAPVAYSAAGVAFGPVREILLPAAATPAFLRLDSHRIQGEAAGADLWFADGDLVTAGDIVRSDAELESGAGEPAAAGWQQRVPVQVGQVYALRTAGGQQARVQVVAVGGPAGDVLHLRYTVAGDSVDRPPGDSGRLAVSWGPEAYWQGPIDLDLEAGAPAASAVDLRVTAAGLHAPYGLQAPAGNDFGGLVAFHASGFVQRAPARLGAVYVVRTRNGLHAKVQVIPGNRVRVALQEGSGQRLQPGELPGGDGLRIYSATLPDSGVGKGIDLRSGELVPVNRADLVLGATGTNVTLNAAGGIADLGPVYLDRISAAPAGTGYRNFVAAKRTYTYAVKTRDGRYALVFVADIDAAPVAYLEVAYQGDGSSAFFPHVDPTVSGMALPTSQNEGSVIRGGAHGGAPSATAPQPGAPVPQPGAPSATAPVPTAPVPAAPTPAGGGYLAAYAGDSQVLLRWLPAAPPDGLAVTGYFVFRGQAPGELRQVNTQPVRGTEYVDRSVRNGETYHYHVVAMWSNEEIGEPTAVRTATPAAGAPDPYSVAIEPSVAAGQAPASGAVQAPASGAAPAPAFGSAPSPAAAAGAGQQQPVSGGAQIQQLQMWIGRTGAVINGRDTPLPVAPFIRDNRTLVPLRFIAEALGAEVTWDAGEGRIGLRLDDGDVQLWLDRHEARINGMETVLDVAPTLAEGHTVVPLRFVVEAFGVAVYWNPGDRSIRIDGRP